jgi:hypothetical protein
MIEKSMAEATEKEVYGTCTLQAPNTSGEKRISFKNNFGFAYLVGHIDLSLSS